MDSYSLKSVFDLPAPFRSCFSFRYHVFPMWKINQVASHKFTCYEALDSINFCIRLLRVVFTFDHHVQKWDVMIIIYHLSFWPYIKFGDLLVRFQMSDCVGLISCTWSDLIRVAFLISIMSFACYMECRYFNSLQSECFPICFHSDVNMIISAPTGSGKTVLFELCVLRLLSRFISADGRFIHLKGSLKTVSPYPKDISNDKWKILS